MDLNPKLSDPDDFDNIFEFRPILDQKISSHEICLKVDRVAKWDFFCKNSQKTVNRSSFVDFNFVYDFFSNFFIINLKTKFDFY